MTPQERDIIGRFIARVGGAQQGGSGGSVPATQVNLPAIDPEADHFISDQFSANPPARYRITQMAFVQEAALAEAQNRIKQLEYALQQAQLQAQQQQQAAPQSRGLFGGLFGGGGAQQAPNYQQQQYAPPPPQPSYPPGYQPGMFRSGGSGFLGSALTTAAGVAGGMLAADALTSMFSGHGGGFGGGGFGGGGFGGGFGGGEVVNETVVNNYGPQDGAAGDPWAGAGAAPDPGTGDGWSGGGAADSGGGWSGGDSGGGGGGWDDNSGGGVVAATTAASDGQPEDTPPLILGSASSARQALLRQAGLDFETCPTGLDETAIKRACAQQGMAAGETAMALAKAKALAVRRPGAVVIGCDQILVCEGALFDKPPDLDAARQHLQRLRGRLHVLETATVVVQDGAVLWRHLETPHLVMRAFSDIFLDRYLAAEGGALLGAVGAYRLEGPGIQLFERIEGDHTAILGLPLLPLMGFLRGLDMIRR